MIRKRESGTRVHLGAIQQISIGYLFQHTTIQYCGKAIALWFKRLRIKSSKYLTRSFVVLEGEGCWGGSSSVAKMSVGTMVCAIDFFIKR